MVVSITHRITGSGMATVGTLLMVWWLAALAGGRDSYAHFIEVFTYKAGGLNILGYVFGIGLTLSLLQHAGTGVRHWVMDTGAGFELKKNRMGAWATIIASLTLTILFWAYLLGGK